MRQILVALLVMTGCRTAPTPRAMPEKCTKSLEVEKQVEQIISPGLNDGISIPGTERLEASQKELDLLVKDTSKSDYDILKICQQRLRTMEDGLQQIKDSQK